MRWGCNRFGFPMNSKRWTCGPTATRFWLSRSCSVRFPVMRPVIAYHLIITTYGFWLPNDPRGSWSDFVRAWELQRFGPATRTRDRRSLARHPHDRKLRLEAKKYLARKPVEYDGIQARAVARGIADFCRKSGCVVWACSILPCHVHIVVKRHRYSIERVSQQLKGAATRQLLTEKLHPFVDSAYQNGDIPTPWARRCWSVFLDSEEDIQRAIRYVEQNPVNERKRAQKWRCVTGYLSADNA
jgi:REP element-mobilizing transposase RayT